MDSQQVVLYSEELEVDGIVQYSDEEEIWVAIIDWNAIREVHTDGSKNFIATNFYDLYYVLCKQPCLMEHTIMKNLEAIADVESGKRTDANAAWWGFDPVDATEGLQAAIDSGVQRLVVPNMRSDWIIRQ